MSQPTVTSVEKQPDAIIVHVQVERLEEDSSHQLQVDVLAAASESPQLPVVVDFAKVSFLPSLSLAALIRLATDFRGRHQRLMLAALQSEVRHVFVLTRLDRLFELHDDVPAALCAVRPA